MKHWCAIDNDLTENEEDIGNSIFEQGMIRDE